MQTISARIVKYKSALAEYGITVEKGNGALKSTFEVLTELKPKWDAMSDAERVALGNTLAGTNQFKVLASVMTNFQTALNANTTALNSENSAMEENDKYMQGIEAGGQRLAATFEQLATKVISSELITALQNLGTTILELVNNPVGRFIIQWGLLSGVLIGAITIFGTIITKIGAMMTAMTAMGGAIAGVASVAAPLAVGLGFVVAAVWNIYQAVKEANPPLSEIKENISALSTEIQTNKDRLDELNATPWYDRTKEIQNEIYQLTIENEKLEQQKQLQEDLAKKTALKEASKDITFSQSTAMALEVTYHDPYIEEVLHTTTYEAYNLAEALERVNQEIEREGFLVDSYIEKDLPQELRTIRDVTKDSGTAYKELTELLQRANDEISKQGKLAKGTQEEILNNNEVLQNLIELYNDLGEDAPAALKALVKEFGNYTTAVNDARRYGTGLAGEVAKAAIHQLDLARATHKATDEFVKLTAQEKIFNNTKLSVNDKIKALEKLAIAYGVNAEAAYAAFAPFALENYSLELGGETHLFEKIKGGKPLFDVAEVTSQIESAFNKLITSPITEDNNDDNGDGTGTKTDRIKQAAEAEYKLAQHYLNMGWRDEKWYYDEIERIANTYYLNVAGYEYDYWKLEEEFTKGRIKLAEQEEERKEAALKEFHEKVQEFLEKREKEMQRQFDLLDHNLAMEYINEDEYYTQLQALAEKYYKGNEKYLSEWESVQERIHEHQVKVAVEGLEYLDKKFQEQIDLFNDYENKINDLYDDEKKKLEDTNAELEKKIEYEKLLDNLAKARAQRRLVYKDGAFQYVQDVGAISSAQLAIDEFNRKQEATAKSEALDRGRAKSLAMNTANKDSAILARMAETSAKWHTVSPQEQKELLRQNDDLASQLSSNARRRYDDITGVWSAYADGTINANGGLSLVGEHGAELRVLNSGDGILPADITKNLFAWGKVSPTSVISNLIDRASASNTITIGNISLPSVTNAQEFVSGLKNIAYQYAYQRGV